MRGGVFLMGNLEAVRTGRAVEPVEVTRTPGALETVG